MWYLWARVSRDDGHVTAYAGCWIVEPTSDRARERALDIIRDCGWHPTEVGDVRAITRDDYAEDDEGLPFFLQAEIDGDVCVFWTSQQQTEE